MTSKIAICFGITGQDGSYLAELLLEKGYRVIGIKRRTSIINTSRVDHLFNEPNFKLEYGDMNDVGSMYRLLNTYKPDEIYNLAAQSHVKTSFDVSENTVDTVGMGQLRLLNAIKELKLNSRIYYAASSEMYGKVLETPQTETTPFYPRSPYACAKVFGFWITKNFRESYGIHASNGILFNHTSPRRGETFVSRKITKAVAKIALGRQEKLYMGNIDAKRDFGYTKEYVMAMWQMLQQDTPDDYVIATGETHSIKEFLERAFNYVGLNWQNYVEIDKKYFRPAEVDLLLGDASKARNVLKWEPKTSFNQLVDIMVESDLQEEKKK